MFKFRAKLCRALLRLAESIAPHPFTLAKAKPKLCGARIGECCRLPKDHNGPHIAFEGLIQF